MRDQRRLVSILRCKQQQQQQQQQHGSQGSHRDLPQQRFDFRAAARRESRPRRACLIARFLVFFSEARERAPPRPWQMECGRGESRRVPARCAPCVWWHGMASYGYIRVLARIRLKRRSYGAVPTDRPMSVPTNVD